jgi:hypothetical protein
MNKQAIKSIVETPAWQEIENFFKEEMLEGKKPLNIKTEGKSADMIALEVMAREQAAKSVDNALKKLRRIANNAESEKESWR